MDHVVVSRFGIFVIETKNMKGKIYGRAASKQWTQYVGRGKFPFQNPLLQNKLHINALKKHLNLPEEIFHNLIFFVGDCTLKSDDKPHTVMTHGLLPVIKSFTTPLLEQSTVNTVTTKLREIKQTTNHRETREAHIAAINERKHG